MILGLLAIFFVTGCAAEESEPENSAVPALELTGRVVDEADLLSAELEEEFTQRLEAIEVQTQAQFVIVTTSGLGGQDIETYSRKLGNAWGVGDAERNDGLLLVVAPNERKVRIEVGRGLETVVTNEEAAAIIQSAILPEFSEGNFEAGVSNAIDNLENELAVPELRKAA